MEMINVPKEKIKEIEKIDFDLLKQFKDSLEDVKAGRIKKVA